MYTVVSRAQGSYKLRVVTQAVPGAWAQPWDFTIPGDAMHGEDYI